MPTRTASRKSSLTGDAKATPRAGARREVLREALIDAAEKTIASEGLAGFNARSLAGEVGCAVGAIYNVFPDLDAIVFEVNSRTLKALEKFVAGRTRSAASKTPVELLVAMSLAYLDFAVAHTPRWRAVFEHIPVVRSELPPNYLADQAQVFALVESPLTTLAPRLDSKERSVFARTMFSAVHGIVSLGLDAKLGSLPVSTLAGQVRAYMTLLGEALDAGGTTLGHRPRQRRTNSRSAKAVARK